jgi:hypothetical protein
MVGGSVISLRREDGIFALIGHMLYVMELGKIRDAVIARANGCGEAGTGTGEELNPPIM